jgi:hypothetical protein
MFNKFSRSNAGRAARMFQMFSGGIFRRIFGENTTKKPEQICPDFWKSYLIFSQIEK